MKYKKLTISCLTIISLGALVFGSIYTIKNRYSKIEVASIDNFESLWSKIYDNNTKLVKLNVSETDLNVLKQKAITPTQKSQYQMAMTSIPLQTVVSKESTLDEYIIAINNYYQNQSDDDNYKEQQQLNESAVNNVLELIKQIDHNLSNISNTDGTITFDLTKSNDIVLKPVSTPLKWSELSQFNTMVTTINKQLQTQAEELKKKKSAEEIVNLKPSIDTFLSNVESYKAKLSENYIKGSDLKKVTNKLTGINVNTNKDWFDTLDTIDEESTFTEGTVVSEYTVVLSDKFFTDNPELNPYKDLLQAIQIKVSKSTQTSITSISSSETYTEHYSYQINTSVSSIKDSDFINKMALSKINIKINQNQKVVAYVPSETTNSSSTTSSSTRSSTTYSTTYNTTTSSTQSTINNSSNVDTETETDTESVIIIEQ